MIDSRGPEMMFQMSDGHSSFCFYPSLGFLCTHYRFDARHHVNPLTSVRRCANCDLAFSSRTGVHTQRSHARKCNQPPQTNSQVRKQLEKHFQQDLSHRKRFIDEKMMLILGQLEAPRYLAELRLRVFVVSFPQRKFCTYVFCVQSLPQSRFAP